MELGYIGVAEQAKMVKKALASAWPGVKFSVRSKSYSGGASISIDWTDGPSTSAVDKVAKLYEGADFDGMQDLKTRKDTVLPSGLCARFLGDFVFTSRSITNFDALAKDAEAIIRARCHVEGNRFGNDWVDDLAHGMVRALNFDKGETLESTFRRVVLREEN